MVSASSIADRKPKGGNMAVDFTIVQRADGTLWIDDIHFVGYCDYPIGKKEKNMIRKMELAFREANKKVTP
jgi:hypothetical protein